MPGRTAYFFLGVAVGVLVSAAWFFGPHGGPVLTQTGNTPKTSADTLPEGNAQSGSVSVADQEAGNSVLVDSVTVAPPGVWVAVREVTDNSLGNILGAAHVRGPVSATIVDLLRPTLPGRTYAVTLYRDDDGDDKFDMSKDSAYVDFDTGKAVIVFFKTTEK